ncbi:hypothetical protein BZG36_03254 [Bifiguratus adelaidae]|uniref:Uncharacterized protein n=1 Tax=Bifiguratus adelaidae TaxID=1938954 RepID=A0A261Y0E0_9FUNG|nr:hypothetical protein BZG36_03254 [Bifiguratus adelaidae]
MSADELSSVWVEEVSESEVSDEAHEVEVVPPMTPLTDVLSSDEESAFTSVITTVQVQMLESDGLTQFEYSSTTEAIIEEVNDSEAALYVNEGRKKERKTTKDNVESGEENVSM